MVKAKDGTAFVRREKRSALGENIEVLEPEAPEFPDVNPKILQAIDLLVTGEVQTITAAAQQVGLSKGGLATALKRENVRKALDKALRDQIGISAVGAIRTITRLSEGAHSEYVQLEASRDLLDRAGVGTEHKPAAGQVQINIDLG